jgi:hypothetical protein
MIPGTFGEFLKGIRSHAEVLRRHGLSDPADINWGRRRWKDEEEG